MAFRRGDCLEIVWRLSREEFPFRVPPQTHTAFTFLRLDEMLLKSRNQDRDICGRCFLDLVEVNFAIVVGDDVPHPSHAAEGKSRK